MHHQEEVEITYNFKGNFSNKNYSLCLSKLEENKNIKITNEKQNEILIADSNLSFTFRGKEKKGKRKRRLTNAKKKMRFNMMKRILRAWRIVSTANKNSVNSIGFINQDLKI